jgi:DNA-binding NtrC family response regulator
MKAGALDYLKKPFDPEELEIVVARAVEHARIRRENARLRRALSGKFSVQRSTDPAGYGRQSPLGPGALPHPPRFDV